MIEIKLRFLALCLGAAVLLGGIVLLLLSWVRSPGEYPEVLKVFEHDPPALAPGVSSALTDDLRSRFSGKSEDFVSQTLLEQGFKRAGRTPQGSDIFVFERRGRPCAVRFIADVTFDSSRQVETIQGRVGSRCL